VTTEADRRCGESTEVDIYDDVAAGHWAGLTVTPLCVGTGELGDMVGVYGYGVPEDRAIATVRHALDGPNPQTQPSYERFSRR
jgi:hypothetical protein